MSTALRRYRVPPAPGVEQTVQLWWDPGRGCYVIAIGHRGGEREEQTCERLIEVVARLSRFSDVADDRLLALLLADRRGRR